MSKHVKYLVADEVAYLKGVFEFRHRVSAMLSARADNAARLGNTELAAEYRKASLRVAVYEELAQ